MKRARLGRAVGRAVGFYVCCGFLGVAAHAGTVDLPYQISGSYAVPVKSMKEVKFAATVRQQYDFSCGSAALSTLLTHHYNFAVTEEKVFEQMFLNGDQSKIRLEGFSLLDMKRYLESLGFEADGFEEPLGKLVTASLPAIVLINQSGYNHFVVVKGVRDGRVLIGDPAGGARPCRWPRSNRLGLTAFFSSSPSSPRTVKRWWLSTRPQIGRRRLRPRCDA